MKFERQQIKNGNRVRWLPGEFLVRPVKLS